MSYPQFNLTTLQLPAPASNMTKAEYKAAYGIDLDQVDIKAFKLVLLGKDKYPITQIKAVEDGYEIYFNGRVLSITDIIQTSDEIYDVSNAKPIYFHPIYLRRDTALHEYTLRCSFFILNNSPTAFTYSTFLSYIKNLMDKGALIQANGVVTGGNENVNVFVGTKIDDNYYLIGNNTTTINNIDIDDYTVDVSFSDGINKIN